MTDLVVHPQKEPLVGSVPVPSDKSVAHRALLVGALCNGKSRIRAYAGGDDNASTRAALEAMGVTFAETDKDVIVTGVGLFGLRAPSRDLDCGNSGTTMRLLCGVLCAQDFDSTLVGDASLSRRPMMRVAGPLRARGARIEGTPHPKKIQPTCEAPMFNGNGANASRVKKPTLYSSAVIAIVSSPG